MARGIQKWEAALLAGMLAGVLASPAGAAEPLVLSRWAAGEGESPRYQISLFPVRVGEVETAALAGPPEQGEPEYEIRLWLLDWWREIHSATAR